MSGPLRMFLAGRTDVGLIREHNEDNLSVVDLEQRTTLPLMGVREVELGNRGALLIVCDGMGGAAAGEVASAMALEAFAGYLMSCTEALPPDESAPDRKVRFARWMREGAFEANRKIYEASRADENKSGMGTTMTTVGVVGTDLVMAQVGDSRAYVLRGDSFVQVTRDQSLVNQLIETGQISEEQARLFEHSNVILQALGVQDDVEVLLSTVPLRRGDRVVVCTDGLTGVVTDEEVAAILASTDDMDEVCRLLIEMARSGGGPDNITAIAVRFDDATLDPATESDTLAYERWRLDEPDEPSDAGGRGSPAREWPAVGRRRRVDPARTFFSVMLLLALSLGGLVMAAQLHRHSGTPCTVVAAPGFPIRVDGRDIGRRSQAAPGATFRLPQGRHKVALQRSAGSDDVRQVDVGPAGDCRITFEEER